MLQPISEESELAQSEGRIINEYNASFCRCGVSKFGGVTAQKEVCRPST